MLESAGSMDGAFAAFALATLLKLLNGCDKLLDLSIAEIAFISAAEHVHDTRVAIEYRRLDRNRHGVFEPLGLEQVLHVRRGRQLIAAVDILRADGLVLKDGL